jgi:hypothetical protein
MAAVTRPAPNGANRARAAAIAARTGARAAAIAVRIGIEARDQ